MSRRIGWLPAGYLGLLCLCPLLLTPQSSQAADTDVKAAIPLLWRASTMSPNPMKGQSDEPLYDICGAPDEALQSVATRNAARQLRGESSFGADELAFNLRAAGAPYVWPRAWTLKGKELDAQKVASSLAAFVDKTKPLGERRCGVARMQDGSGVELVSLVLVDALADVQRTPTLARVGEWITLKGTLVSEASDLTIVLLGPRGKPRTVLANLTQKELRTTFMVDQPGEWLVQVVATVATGPRPVLELPIHAGTAPPLRFAETPAPGESAAPPNADDEVALAAMVNAARKAEGLAPLARDSSLDKLAREHSVVMREARLIGHDVGHGSPEQRLHEGGISFRTPGENIAGAKNIVRAHRALWMSPSHRGNLLEERFGRIGIGVVKSEDGRVWVTQLFTD